MSVRAIRGATTADQNTRESIFAATEDLLLNIAKLNEVDPENIISVMFTATPDLNATFPAAAARALGWTGVPLIDAVEIDVEGALPRCIRVLLTIETTKQKDELIHVYLKEAKALRPDLTIREDDRSAGYTR